MKFRQTVCYDGHWTVAVALVLLLLGACAWPFWTTVARILLAGSAVSLSLTIMRMSLPTTIIRSRGSADRE